MSEHCFEYKTVCEEYNDIESGKYSKSIMLGLYYALHFKYYKDHGCILPQIRSERKVGFYQNIVLKENSYIDTMEHVDILMNFISYNANYLGVQEVIYDIIKPNYSVKMFHDGRMNDQTKFGSNKILLELHNISEEKVREINAQEEEINKKYLKKLDIASIAVIAERLIETYKYELKRCTPKCVIVFNNKDIKDAAIIEACCELGIKTLLIPHGFPQFSQGKIDTDYLAVTDNFTEKYYSLLSSDKTKIIRLGWLEPLVTKISYKKNVTMLRRYNVIFLSQMQGYNVHDCPSLLTNMETIICVLDKMFMVKKIILRLRKNEMSDPIIADTINRLIKYKKLRISVDCSLHEDINKSNVIMSMSSTGLLYGPYLGIKSLEIRDEKINSVWRSSILPSSNVINISEFNSITVLKKLRDQKIEANSLFFNYQNESYGIKKIIDEIVNPAM